MWLYLHSTFVKSFNLSLTLFKLMIPIIIIMKILEQMGVVNLLSELLAPIMELVGLPGTMGLVWATALMTNLYGGIVVYATLAPETPMTVAQVTLISAMMLIAHALPLEARIAQKAGVSFTLTVLLRVSMAIFFAAIFNQIYLFGEWLQQPSELLWSPDEIDPSLSEWAMNQVIGLGLIICIVFSLVFFLDLLKKLGIIQWFNRQLRPLLHLLGIGREAETITLIGLTLGISYGGALLIQEAEAGEIKPHDILFSISLLGLSHSLIEDTLLMMLIGAHLSAILVGRILFSVSIIFIMVKIVNIIPDRIVHRYLVRSVS
ncbi:hypothetical protein D5085_01430 [Ectothiorhodospiraceae bacterium BW-2]|nr:hypothetical protein D5085_01430 [Ectothiorhodospiraceae bacterium BW-2]